MIKQIGFDSNQSLINSKVSTVEQQEHKQLTVQSAQENIYRILLDLVKQGSPETALQEFKHIFIQHTDSGSPESIAAVYEIIFANDEETFHYTIKRACYILINNWSAGKNQQYTQKLIELFADPVLSRQSFSPTINRLRTWTNNFINNKDFQELKLFVSSKSRESSRLSNRYKSHLLIAQSADISNPIEQREAALNRAKQLQYRFKFDLAMYMAHLGDRANYSSKNPTKLGNETLRVIKIIVAKQDPACYTNLAKKFVDQTQTQSYKEFKQSIKKYLITSGESQQLLETIRRNLSIKLTTLQASSDEQLVNQRLILKTCKQLISCLTIESQNQPTPSLRLLIAQSHPLTLVIILLKIVLVCRDARTHLEACIAELIRYYEDSDQPECKWIVDFLEILNIMFAIYADNLSLQLEKIPVASVDHIT